MKFSKKHIKDVETLLEWYENVINGDVKFLPYYHVCENVKNASCDCCLFGKVSDDDNFAPCITEARRNISALSGSTKRQEIKQFQKHAKKHYQEILESLDKWGYEYK